MLIEDVHDRLLLRRRNDDGFLLIWSLGGSNEDDVVVDFGFRDLEVSSDGGGVEDSLRGLEHE